MRGAPTITPTAEGTFTYALTCGGQESGFATLAVNNNSSLQIDPAQHGRAAGDRLTAL